MSVLSKVLIVEDDPAIRLGCEQALRLEDIAAEAVESAEQALERIGPEFPGAVVTDVRLPGASGLELQRRLHVLDGNLPVIVMTGHGDVSMAVTAMRDGAYDFIEKPFSSERLLDTVRRALEKRRLFLEVLGLRRRLEDRQGIESRIVGRSPAIERLRRLILDIADTPADVLVIGETGTGKEMVARCLHDYGSRRKNNFVAVNCGGLPESLFESEMFGHEAGAFTGAAKRRIGKIEHADGGTLFLDEIESMPANLQVKLLRVLQERQVERLGSNRPVPVDVRVVAATKEDLLALSRQQKFRADLYFRLDVVALELPPLRERREDIPLLFEHFVLQAAARYRRDPPELIPALARDLVAQTWAGNVRELRNAADRYVLGLRAGSLVGSPGAGDRPPPLPELVEQFERSVIAEALRQHDGRLSRTAEALGIAKTTLHDKIRRYGLVAEGSSAGNDGAKERTG